jgi:hypothetical protein
LLYNQRHERHSRHATGGLYRLATSSGNPNQDLEDRLAALMVKCKQDPLLFAKIAYPWGQGELKDNVGPREWQSDILADIKNHLSNPETRFKPCRIAIASGHGAGKAHTLDTVIDTPSGKRLWGDIRAGDLVFGADGKPISVVQVHNWKSLPIYRVTFDDGTFADVSEGHLWNVRGRRERRNRKDTWRTLETKEIATLGVKRPNGVGMARTWQIPMQGAAEFEEREIDLHPYLVGLWLGDGTKGIPAYTKPYPEPREKLTKLGYTVVLRANGCTNYIRDITSEMDDAVFSCESHERYIPDDYKYNTAPNRMALFEGLCDSDGEANKGGTIGFSSTSKQLAEDMLWLARSLGCKALMQPTPKIGKYRDDNGEIVVCKPCYRLTINAPFNPFSIAHKRNAYKPSEERYLTRWIESIEPIGRKNCMCISVEAKDGLYQANDFIVTHNSALISMVCNWAMATCIDTKIVVTANTADQLRTKTWPELSKWFRNSIVSHWFSVTATSAYAADADHERTWRTDAITWSDTNTEAFAGLHNKGKRIVLVFDEGSAISDKVWEVAEGAMTDSETEIIWLAFGNPTRNTGRFKDCFERFKHRWINRHIDSRTVDGTNKEQFAQWVADYGEDSDFVRIRVKGEFPRAGSAQFIPSDIVSAAAARIPESYVRDVCVMGVDVARFGDDESAIVVRRGRDASSVPWVVLRNTDTMTLAAKIMEIAAIHRPDAIFVDGGGVGGGVVDRLMMMKQPVIEVQFGSASDKGITTQEGMVVYANKRAEMYGAMKDWLRGGSIPNDPDLISQLCAIEYGYTMLRGKDAILLEKKADMKRRGLPSPDKADALAVTFAHPVLPSIHAVGPIAQATHQIEYSYDPRS